ncbi:cytochrome P450 monooxygenase-like protein [Phaeosphaeria sp. MPI-PUGE-AT-0046c]|nr:cytochrome P450 monooxygenase-like protein [Phaeosphaeria sp. MPI-PUGE-AT-0046c]
MALFVLALSLLAAYFLASALYDIFFHPLAKVPGPFLPRLSVLPSFYHACKGDRHVWIWQNFQLFGDTFRAAPNLVLFNKPQAYQDIYGARAKITRSGFYRSWKRNEHDVNTITATEPALHAKKRKALNLAFSEQSLKAAGPLMAEHIDRWIELLTSDAGDGWSSPQNLAPWVDNLVFDLIGDLCFGESFDTKEPGKNRLKQIPHLIMKHVKIGYVFSKSSLIGLILYLQPRGLHRLQERIRHADTKAHDMFYFLLNARDQETQLPAYTERNQILSEARLLVLAGTDTSASTICSIFFYLANNAAVLEKLTAEIRSTFHKVEDIVVGTKLSRCQYLRACVDEALRINPPAPGELSREVLPGGATIQGSFYPAGTIVGCAPWSMGRDEEVYGDAMTYRPERWIAASKNGSLIDDDYVRSIKKQFHPFSMGSRDCAGRNLAMLELLLVCARTVWKTDIRLAPGDTTGQGRPELGWGQDSRHHYIVKDSFLCLKNGPVLQFKLRADL